MPLVLTYSPLAFLASASWLTSPLFLVIILSVVIGLVMVVVFRYTSDQKAIHVAKDRLKAHLLAVRLYQDQLSVVVRAYGRILLGTGRYIRLAFMPLLIVIIPMTYMIVQLDWYLGYSPIAQAEPFLVKVKAASAEAINDVSLQLPAEIAISAPPVHVPTDSEIVWRLVADKDGTYDIKVASAGQTFAKKVVVAGDVSRISLSRMRAPYWKRLFSSSEPALPESSPIQAIDVTYPARNIEFAWTEWNWIVLFFVLSLVAGFVFKSVLGIEI
jgi:uncharacterized membrane protein (DUF106 family)